MGWPGNRPGPGNRLEGSLPSERVDNRLECSLHPERVDNTVEHSLGTKVEVNLTFQRAASETAKVEHRLPLSQQVGGTRRGVTDVARRGTRGTKAATRRQSNSPRTSPSGKMQPTSRHRQRMWTWETRTQDGTLTNSNTCKFPPFLSHLYKTLMLYPLINNLT